MWGPSKWTRCATKSPFPRRDVEKARLERAFSFTAGPPREWSVAHRLEVVRGRVVGDVPAERLALHVRAAVVEASPDACLDELGHRL